MKNEFDIERRNVLFSIPNPGNWSNAESQKAMLVAICKARPTISRLELLVTPRREKAVKVLRTELNTVLPELEIKLIHKNLFGDDFAAVYGVLYGLFERYEFNRTEEDYYVDMTGGTIAVRAYLLNMIKDRIFPLTPIFPRRIGKGQSAVIPFELVDIAEVHLMAWQAARAQRVKQGADSMVTAVNTKNENLMNLLKKAASSVSRSSEPILITGPTGVGKSMLAKAIYKVKTAGHEKLKGGFVEVNCAELTGDNLRSMLFGHTKGSFTGATNYHKGYLEQADGGLLFLDEIGDLSAAAQVTLLKAIEERKFWPLGSEEQVESNFQLVSGTNRDISLIEDGGPFQRDFLSRIRTFTIRLPGLKDRPEDIVPTIDETLENHKGESGVGIEFTVSAREKYLRFATSSESIWPDNFRGLTDSIHRMAMRTDIGRIDDEVVDDELAELRLRWRDEKSFKLPQIEKVKNVFPDALNKWGLIDCIKLSYILEACDESDNGAEAYRNLRKIDPVQFQEMDDNDSLGMSRALEKFNSNFKEIKMLLRQSGKCSYT